ncbi:hypothetical protein [Halobacillus mangrovi]
MLRRVQRKKCCGYCRLRSRESHVLDHEETCRHPRGKQAISPNTLPGTK